MPVCCRCTYENESGATRCEMCGSENFEKNVSVGTYEKVNDDDAEFSSRLADVEQIGALESSQKLTDEEFARKLQEEEDQYNTRKASTVEDWARKVQEREDEVLALKFQEEENRRNRDKSLVQQTVAGRRNLDQEKADEEFAKMLMLQEKMKLQDNLHAVPARGHHQILGWYDVRHRHWNGTALTSGAHAHKNGLHLREGGVFSATVSPFGDMQANGRWNESKDGSELVLDWDGLKGDKCKTVYTKIGPNQWTGVIYLSGRVMSETKGSSIVTRVA